MTSPVYGPVYAPLYGGMAPAVPDSLVIANSIELLGGPGGVPSANPLCAGATFKLQPGYDQGAQQPTNDFVGSLALDGERPFGRRSSDRTITLPLQIIAPDFTTLAGALEVLSQAIDQQQWTLAWTRDASGPLAGGLGIGLPLVLDCFRAQASQVTYGGADQSFINPIAALTITFQALPYGRSDQPVIIPVASPIPGQPVPPAPVVLDTFSSVSGTNFASSTRHIVGPNSAKWTHGGASPSPVYAASGLALNLTGLTTLSVWAGVGADFPGTFVNPCTILFSLTDNAARKITFSVTRTLTPSASASVPNWKLITAQIPQGRTFSYANVTAYSLNVSSVPASPAGIFGFGFNTWYDHLVANPPSVQVPGARGAVYNLLGVAGTARAPVAVQAQQPGATATDVLSAPGPGLYRVPSTLVGTTLDVTTLSGGGAGASVTGAGEGGGGTGGGLAREAALTVTPGELLPYVVGAGGQPQSSISTLAITTAGLPSGTVGAGYNAQGGAFLKLIDFSFITGQQQNFDGGIGTWTGAGNCATTATASPVRQGSGAMVMTATAAATMNAGHCTAGNILTQGKPCAAGDSINCRAWFQAAVTPRSCQVGAEFYTSGGVIIGSAIFAASAPNDAAGSWTFVQGQVTAPATSAFCRLMTRVNSPANAEAHYVDDALLGPSTLAQAIVQWQALTGRTMAVRREYFGAGVYGTGAFAITADLTADAAAGRKVCLTLRPPFSPTSSTDRTNMATFLASCKAAGLDMDITLWHEPFFAGLTAAQYIAMVNFYGPTVRAQYPLVFGTGGTSVQNNNENAYYPGDSQVDKCVTDYYADGYVAGRRLDLPAAPADNAVPPKPFGVWEMNASTSAQNQADGTAYFQYVQGYFANRLAAGKQNAEVLLFNGDTNAGQETPLTDALDYRLTLWQALADSVSNATIAASGGAPPYTFSSTTLPAGLTLNATTGVLTGTPTAAGTTLVTFTVTDALGATASAALAIRVIGTGTLIITTTTLPGGAKGAAYSQALATNGLGTPPLTWSLAAGSGPLPAGLALSAAGVISGVPTATGTFGFNVQVSDSAAHSDTQLLSIVVTSVSVATKPLVGFDNGQGAFGGAAGGAYAAIFAQSHIAGQSFGSRGYGGNGGSGPGNFPTSFADHCSIPSTATFALQSWAPDIPTVLAGGCDAAITAFGVSCQKAWNANPGSLYIALWHEGDRHWTSAQFLAAHAYVYPRFKAACRSVGGAKLVPYGQITTEFHTGPAPSSWVSCPATVAGGSKLDFYGLDGYTNVSNTTGDATGYRTPTAVFSAAFNGILGLVPTATLLIGEANCETYAQRANWFGLLWTMITTGPYPCAIVCPFFSGSGSGDTITYNVSDSPAPGTNAAIRAYLAQGAPAGALPTAFDPPAVDGIASSFTGDSVTVTEAGGKSATSIAGATFTSTSTNTVHEPGGAGAAGAASGGAGPGASYICAQFGLASAGLTPSVPVTAAVALGDALVVAVSNATGSITALSDSQGNTYSLIDSKSTASIAVYVFQCLNVAHALTTSDHFLPTQSSATSALSCVALGVSGVLAVAALDVSGIGTTATSTAPSVGPSPTLAQASEWVVAVCVNGNGGGLPTAWTGLSGSSARGSGHGVSSHWLSVNDLIVSAATAKTAGCTVVSTLWAMVMVTLKFSSGGGAAFGGGGGSAPNATTAGGAGTLSAGGIPPAGAAAGGAGSPVADSLPSQGGGPGAAGGGAASSSGAMLGAAGLDGQIIVTRTTSQQSFSSLILHTPGPDAPQALSPLVSLGSSPVIADGTIEYPVPSLVAGVNAAFGGTYSVLAVAQHWDTPATTRVLQVTVSQYEYVNGPVYRTSVQRTFSPSGDGIANGIVELGTMTLPLQDVAPDNTQCFYTVMITDTDPLDTFLDVLFIDTMGQTVFVSDPAPAAHLAYYVDAPATTNDIGRVLGTSSDRTAAISVMDKCVPPLGALSGGPLTVYPGGDNLLLAYAREGSPQLLLIYWPTWFIERLS